MVLISFSGGRSSAYMLYTMLDQVRAGEALVVFCNTGKESPQTLDFVQQCASVWGVDIVWLEYQPVKPFFKIVSYETASRNGEPFEALIRKKKGFLPNKFRRFCTEELKVKTINRYLKSVGVSHALHAIGIRADEKHRPRNPEKKYPLWELGVTSQQVKEFWKNQAFDLQLNKPLGNCDLCPCKGLQARLSVLQANPAAAKWWQDMEEVAGGKFDNNLSVKQLLNLSKELRKQATLFDDNGFSCFCTD